MAREISPFLMFEGQAEEAMNFYVTLVRRQPDRAGHPLWRRHAGAGGHHRHRRFTLGGRQFLCSDSYVSHAFSFTPSISIFVECVSEAEIESSLCQADGRRAGADADRRLRFFKTLRLGERTGSGSPGN